MECDQKLDENIIQEFNQDIVKSDKDAIGLDVTTNVESNSNHMNDDQNKISDDKSITDNDLLQDKKDTNNENTTDDSKSNVVNNAIILQSNINNCNTIELINKLQPTSDRERSSITDIILSNHIIGIDR